MHTMPDAKQCPLVVTAGSPVLLLPTEIFHGWQGAAPGDHGVPSDLDVLEAVPRTIRKCGYARLSTFGRRGLTGLVLELDGPLHWLAEADGGVLVKLNGLAYDEAHLRSLVARVKSFSPWTSFSLPGGDAVLLDASCHHAELEEGHHAAESWLRLQLGAGRFVVDVASEWGVEVVRIRRG
jgi:hypothetical protein